MDRQPAGDLHAYRAVAFHRLLSALQTNQFLRQKGLDLIRSERLNLSAAAQRCAHELTQGIGLRGGIAGGDGPLRLMDVLWPHGTRPGSCRPRWTDDERMRPSRTTSTERRIRSKERL
jgi:hypothetical protein